APIAHAHPHQDVAACCGFWSVVRRRVSGDRALVPVEAGRVSAKTGCGLTERFGIGSLGRGRERVAKLASGRPILRLLRKRGMHGGGDAGRDVRGDLAKRWWLDEEVLRHERRSIV